MPPERNNLERGNSRLGLALALGSMLLAPSAEAGPKRDLREAQETITADMESLPDEWAGRLEKYIQDESLTLQADGTYQSPNGDAVRLADEGFLKTNNVYEGYNFISDDGHDNWMRDGRDSSSLIFLPTTREDLTERQEVLENLTLTANREISAIADEIIRQSILDVMRITDMRVRPDGSYLSKDGQVYWLTAKGVYDADNKSTVVKRDDFDEVQTSGWDGPGVGILDYLPITESIKSRQDDLRQRETAALDQANPKFSAHLPKILERENMALQESGYYTSKNRWDSLYYITTNGLYNRNWLTNYNVDRGGVDIELDTTLSIADMIPISDEQKGLAADVEQRINGLKLERSAEGWFVRQGHEGKYMFFDNGDLLYYDGAKTQLLPRGANMNDGWRRTTAQESQAFAVKYLGLTRGGGGIYHNHSYNESGDRIFKGRYISIDSGMLYISDPEQAHLTDQFLPNGADIKTGWRRPSVQELQQIFISIESLTLDTSGGYYKNSYSENKYYLLPNGDARVVKTQDNGTEREYIWDHRTLREKEEEK